jgi:hypothetical protein
LSCTARQAAGGPSAQIAELREGLAAWNLSRLTDNERLGLLTELELLVRALGGVSVRTQVGFHTSQVASQVQAGVAPSRAGRAVPDDLARARRTSPYWGSRELTSAKALVREMPCTLLALDKGEITLLQARVITEATTCLSPEDRDEVDRRLTGSLAGSSTAEIGATVRGLVYEVDPNGFVERARKASQDRGVSIRPCPDVMALLSARLPAPLAIACYAGLKDHAARMRAAGDPRTMAQLMADELFARLTGRTVVDGVDVEVGVVITDAALFDGTSAAADLVGYGPIPAEMARDLLRPEEDEAPRTSGTAGDDVPCPPTDACPDGPRCSSWSCGLEHDAAGAAAVQPARAAAGEIHSPAGSPDQQASASPQQSAAGTAAAQVWLRRLWSDPATGVLSGRDTRRRLFTGSLRAALVARDRTCRNTWCGAPIRAIDHRMRARDGGPTSDTNGQGLCQRCNNAREHPRAVPPGQDDYRPPPPLLPTFLQDRSPSTAA